MVADLVGERRSAVGRRERLTGQAEPVRQRNSSFFARYNSVRHVVRAQSQLTRDVVTRQLLEHDEPHDALLHVRKLRNASHQPELFLGTREQLVNSGHVVGDLFRDGRAVHRIVGALAPAALRARVEELRRS